MLEPTRRLLQFLANTPWSSVGVTNHLFRLTNEDDRQNVAALQADLNLIIQKADLGWDKGPAEQGGPETPQASSVDWEQFQYDHEEGTIYVRRLQVPSGWLYQVRDLLINGQPDATWSPPVFVPGDVSPKMSPQAKSYWDTHGSP